MSEDAKGFIVGGALTAGGIALAAGVPPFARFGPMLIAAGLGQIRRSLQPNRMSQHVQWQNSKSGVSPLPIVYGLAVIGRRRHAR